MATPILPLPKATTGIIESVKLLMAVLVCGFFSAHSDNPIHGDDDD